MGGGGLINGIWCKKIGFSDYTIRNNKIPGKFWPVPRYRGLIESHPVAQVAQCIIYEIRNKNVGENRWRNGTFLKEKLGAAIFPKNVLGENAFAPQILVCFLFYVNPISPEVEILLGPCSKILIPGVP